MSLKGLKKETGKIEVRQLHKPAQVTFPALLAKLSHIARGSNNNN